MFFIVECGTTEIKINVEEGSILECSNKVEYLRNIIKFKIFKKYFYFIYIHIHITAPMV
jgi:hypothetical protein